MLDLQHKGNFVELDIRDQWSHQLLKSMIEAL